MQSPFSFEYQRMARLPEKKRNTGEANAISFLLYNSLKLFKGKLAFQVKL